MTWAAGRARKTPFNVCHVFTLLADCLDAALMLVFVPSLTAQPGSPARRLESFFQPLYPKDALSKA